MSQMEKAYDPTKYEADIYKMWEKSGAFKPSSNPAAESFSILMPPPNANADLHIGQTLTTTLEDIMIRFARMSGKAALFLPGADHAGFETQVVFERHLEKQGKSRFDYSRQELYQLIWEFVQKNKVNMENQQRAIGASVDWSRNTFTLDPHIVDRTYKTFKQLHQDGLLYRGKRIVNYCTFHGTSFSDLEVEYEERKGKLWHISYPLADSDEMITVATTRPETMLGDTAVAVDPDDERYRHLVGQLVKLPLTARQIPIVADEAVDKEFGTGAVKVTPAHDPLDFEIAERHSLPSISVIGFDGKMTTEAPVAYRNLAVKEARTRVAKDLDDNGLIAKTQNYTHSVGHCYKCGNVLEPLLMDQWLIKMKPLAARAIRVLEEGQIKVVPTRMKKILFQWLTNIKDWNISRQIAWGIPIPAYFAKDGSVLIDWKQQTRQIKGHRHKIYTQDPDTFDTWFSSGQWPFATLRYPDGADFKRFYPVSVMETAGEIIFFWVARMIMLGLYVTDEIPFKVIYLHGLVTDEHGKKMSKSRGNVVSPIDLLDRYGADALRMGLVANRSAGLNQGFSVKRVETYQKFSNKLWNVARFALDKTGAGHSPAPPEPKNIADEWILYRLSQETEAVTKALEAYKFSEASERVYSLLWSDFADWYVEVSKVSANPGVLAYSLETILKLAHPFAPFVTEVIWQKIPWQKQNLIISDWPKRLKAGSKKSATDFEQIKALVSQIRRLGNDLKLGRPNLLYRQSNLIEENAELLRKISRAGEIKETGEGTGLRLESSLDVWLDVDAKTLGNYTQSLELKRKEAGEYLAKLNKQLDNKRYTKSAPKHLVEQTRDRKKQNELLISRLDEQIKSIKA